MPSELTCVFREDHLELFSTLTHKVRVLTVLQIARTWPKVLSHLKRLEEEGLIFSFMTVAHPELTLLHPVIKWSKSGALPDFAKASYNLRGRWNQSGIATKCIIASRLTGRMFGGHGGRYPRESEETHDIHLAAVYLRFRLDAPTLAAGWIHEEEIKRDRKQRRGKLPDALVCKQRVIEFGGAYKKNKLISFHRFCEARNLEYEVW